ncbi:inositol 2-dehydrogenase [Actinoplanes sp. ATCC 53533]|nr:inositol 2-dehydrogenase [Actinoplanes sp. ATCC 53533]
MSVLRVGVIGAGVMGTDHAVILDRFVSGAVVSRVSDVDAGRAAGVAARLSGARVSPDALGLIGDPDVDVVVIASSDATHAEFAIAAVRAGKPVLCEKPLAPTLALAAGVARTVEREMPGLLSLGFMRRFDPVHVELKAALAAGACGTPLLVHCVSRGVSAGPGTTSESSITGSAVHEFDTVPWLLGAPVVEVAWHAPRCSGEVDGMQDPQVILLRTADGVLTTVEVFLNARYGYDIRCEVVGERGVLSTSGPAHVVRDASGMRSSGYPADWRPRFADAYRLELQAWVDAVTTGAPTPLATSRDGLIAAAVSDAVITSMSTGGRWTAVDVGTA